MKQAVYFEIEPELNKKLREYLKADRRSLTSFLTLLIENKLNEVDNGN